MMTPAFLVSLAAINCCGGDAFNLASEIATKKRGSLILRHVGVSHSHTPEDNGLEKNFASNSLLGIEQNTSSTQKFPTGIQASAHPPLSPIEAAFTKYAMLSYVAHMCVALPMVLLPTYIKNEVMTRLGLQTKSASEHEALQVSQKCASTLLKLIPFMNLNVSSALTNDNDPVPTIWVSNHLSMLDTFVFLSSDEQIRGKNRRPIKTIYWKGLDSNPICKIVFSMAGFIPIDMADNGNGHPNEYNKASFKNMLKETHRAIKDGFDIFILPEGQLNPTPENGLQPVFGSPFAIAKGSKRPIQMIGLYGCHHLWPADDEAGMKVVGRDVKVKVFPPCKKEFGSAAEFIEAFNAVVGTFGASGQELSSEELDHWLT